MMSYEWELGCYDEAYSYDSGGDDEDFDSYGSLDISMDNYSSFKHVPLKFTDQIQQLDKLKISSYGMAISIFVLALGMMFFGKAIAHGLTDGIHVMFFVGGMLLLIAGAAAIVAYSISRSQAKDALSAYPPQKR